MVHPWNVVESLYRDHARRLLRLAVLLSGDRAVAEELVHEAFVRYHRAGSRARPESELAYLRRTVVNLAHGHHRRNAIARRHLRPVEEVAPSADASFAARERRRRVVDAVRRLPYRQQACVVLRYWGGMTDAETADALGISAGSVKTHLHRARRRLAEHLEDMR